MSATGQDRRLSQRIRLQIPMFIRGFDAFGDRFLELGKTLDISAGGAFLTSARPLRENEIISLTIPTPAVSSAGLVPAETPPIQARVLRQQETGDVFLIGVAFQKLLA